MAVFAAWGGMVMMVLALGWNDPVESPQAENAPQAPIVKGDTRQWSDRLWAAALSDDLAGVEAMLATGPQGSGEGAAALERAVAKYQSHKELNEVDRLAELAKRTKSLSTAMTERDITSALVHGVNMRFLMPESQWTAWLAGADGTALEAMAKEEREKAVTASDLLLAQEILFRHKALHDGIDNATFKSLDGELDELNRQVQLIAAFAPRELHRMRKTQVERLERIAREEGKDLPVDEDEFPPYNELFADDWKERIKGISPRIVLQGLRQAASEHVTAAGWKPLMLGGFQAIDTLLDTEQLAENFPKLADAGQVAEMRTVVQRLRETIEQLPAEKVGPSAFRSSINELIAANSESVELPEELLLREFGEGATTQLSKEYEDDYSEIIWPDDLRRFKQQIEGNFVGVGILIRHNDKRELIIVNPLEGSPAARAGIRPGDRCVAVDDQPTEGWTLNRAVSNITGPVGKPVKLTVRRDGVEQSLDFTLKRDSIKMRSVNGWWKQGIDAKGRPAWDWWIDPTDGIGYVRLTGFNEDSLNDFTDAIRQMKRERSLNGLILDLRGNPGGLLKSAVGFVNLFVENGPIVSVQDRDGNLTGEFSAERVKSSLAGLPLVVLVNGQSASASEIVSGSLQTHGAAVVLGDRSFGKGSVQTVQPIEDGEHEAAVKVTTQYYVLPPLPGQEKGRLVHRRAASDDWGVNPDLTVEMTPPQSEKSLETRLALDSLDEVQSKLTTVDVRPDVTDLLEKRVDPQLELALLLLQARVVGEQQADHLARHVPPTKSKAEPQ